MSAEDKCAGSLLGGWVGDALGGAMEGLSTGMVTYKSREPRRLPDKISSCRYSSVSEMAAAVAVSLSKNPDFDGADMAERLVSFQSSGRRYGQGTGKALELLRSGCEWNSLEEAWVGRACAGNAAAARSGPIGLLPTRDSDWIRWVAEEACGITHTHSLATEASVLMALAVHLAFRATPGSLDGRWLLQTLADQSQVRELSSRLRKAMELMPRRFHADRVVSVLGNNTTALGSVPTALFLFAHAPDDLEEAVCSALALGGNSSAIASMVGTLAGAYLGTRAIPDTWLVRVEGGEVDTERLRDVAEVLASGHRAVE